MTPETYWKLKAAILHADNALLKLQSMAAHVHADKQQAIRDAGLDPVIEYSMDDTTCTVTPKAEMPAATPAPQRVRRVK